MAGFFISDLRRALGSAGFFLACLITILIWVVSTLDLLPIPDETVLTIYENGNVGQMQILMPAVAALPYGTAFSDEWRSRYFRLQLLRGNVIEWLLSIVAIGIPKERKVSRLYFTPTFSFSGSHAAAIR